MRKSKPFGCGGVLAAITRGFGPRAMLARPLVCTPSFSAARGRYKRSKGPELVLTMVVTFACAAEPPQSLLNR